MRKERRKSERSKLKAVMKRLIDRLRSKKMLIKFRKSLSITFLDHPL